MHLGLAEVALLQVHDAEQRACLGVVRHRSNGLFEQRARLVELAAGRGHLPAQLLDHRVVRRRLHQQRGGRFGFLDLALAHLHLGQRTECGQPLDAFRALAGEIQRLLVVLLGGREIAALEIDAARRHPVARLLLDRFRGLVDHGLCRGQAPGLVRGRSESEQGFGAVGLRGKRRLELNLGVGRTRDAEQGLALRDLHRHLGGRRRLLRVALREDLVELALGREQLALGHHDDVGLGAEVLRLLDLDRAALQVAGLDERLPEQCPRLGVLGLGVHQVLEVDDRGAVVALGQGLVRAVVQRFALGGAGGRRHRKRDEKRIADSG